MRWVMRCVAMATDKQAHKEKYFCLLAGLIKFIQQNTEDQSKELENKWIKHKTDMFLRGDLKRSQKRACFFFWQKESDLHSMKAEVG